MEYWNGNLAVKTWEAEYPFAVDVPVPPEGLGTILPIILDAARACPNGAQVWSHGEARDGERIRFWSRIGTTTPTEARRMARMFSSIGARRVR
jgi:hypothetical protein